MARACATQSQALTMFEVKLKIQPLSSSQTRQAATADGYQDTVAGMHKHVHSETQHCASTAFSRCLLPPFSAFPGISYKYLVILHSF